MPPMHRSNSKASNKESMRVSLQNRKPKKTKGKGESAIDLYLRDDFPRYTIKWEDKTPLVSWEEYAEMHNLY